MTLILVVSLFFGFQAGQIATKRELVNDGAYFCRVVNDTKRCYDVKIVEDPYAETKYKKRLN